MQVLDHGPGFGVEQMILNQTDPNKDVNGEKSSLTAPHPFLTDPKVREAMSWLVDRNSIATNLYGPAGKPTCNILLGIPPALQSTTNQCGYDVAKANSDPRRRRLGEGLGRHPRQGRRPVEGRLQTTVNPVREKEEQVIKGSFQQAGIGMDIKNADAGVFFGQPDNPDAAQRMDGKDIGMYTTGPSDPDAGSFLEQLCRASSSRRRPTAGRPARPVAGRATSTTSSPRSWRRELNPEKRATIEKQMNDIIVTNYFHIPIVDRYSATATPKSWSTRTTRRGIRRCGTWRTGRSNQPSADAAEYTETGGATRLPRFVCMHNASEHGDPSYDQYKASR